jgi:hypothetical protein
MLLFVGCGNNNNNPLSGGCNGLTWADAYEDEFQEVVETGTVHGEQQTVQSCEANKSALQSWYNALEGLGQNCLIGVTEQQYEEALQEAQQDIDDIDCSEFDGNG